MKAIPVRENVFWVGAMDPDLRVFDIVMRTDHGTTYNSYLVRAGKTALVDAVKEGFENQLLDRVSSVMPPEKIDYIVINHTEPDHSGALGVLLEKMPRATVVASKTAIKFLREMVNGDFPCLAVADGDQIDLGGKTLTFIPAPFLHWPDSMFTYLPENRVLFTCDAFGCHYCGESIFNDLTGDISGDYRYYYDVIMSPFSGYVQDAVERIRPLDYDLIAPSHGPVLRENPGFYVEKYAAWSSGESTRTPNKKVVVAFLSAYGNTRVLADEIGAGLQEGGAEPVLINMQKGSPVEVAGLVNDAGGLLVGSPTINRDAVYPIWELLGHLSPIINRGKPAAAFGSYGWSGEAVKLIEERLSGLQFKALLRGLRVNFTPGPEDRSRAREFGRNFAALLK